MRRRASPAKSPSKRNGNPASQAPATASKKPPPDPGAGGSSPVAGRLRLDTTAGSAAAPESGQASEVIGPSTACGPISTTASTASPARVSTQARNATGARICRRQYAASSASPDPIVPPVRLLTKGIDGGARASRESAASRSSIAGSIMALW